MRQAYKIVYESGAEMLAQGLSNILDTQGSMTERRRKDEPKGNAEATGETFA